VADIRMRPEVPIRILLAEDNESDKHLIANTLKDSGIDFQLDWVQDGDQLMDFLLNRAAFQDRRQFKNPDIILLDLKMPNKGGQETFHEIMNNAELRRIPIIFLTSLVDQDTAVQLMKSGATDYLSKNRLNPESISRSIRYAMELKYREELRVKAENVATRLGRVLDNAAHEIFIFSMDGHRIMQANRGARRHLGYSAEEMLQLRPLSFMPNISEEKFSELLKPLVIGETTEVCFETVQQRKNGSRYPVDVQIQISRLEAPPVFFALVQDLSERKMSEAKLEQAAFYDSLTNIPNRSLFKERLSHAVAQASRTNQFPAVVCANLNRFKAVMETHGADVCETIIKTAADRLKECLRDGDTAARVNGDEFMLLILGSGQETDLIKIAERVVGAFQKPFWVDRHELHLTASVGLSVYPGNGKDAETLMKHASTAMYHAKEQGRSNYQLFNPSMNAKAFGRLAIENSLRHALERNEFQLVYQPVFDVKSNQITEAEALIRWNHPEMGLVYPNDFIPMAEQSGLIVPIGEWVLRNACLQCHLWHNIGMSPLSVSVNISVQQIKQKEFSELVENILRETNLKAQNLILEVTENVFMENLDTTLDTLSKLRKIGVAVAIDDFGTGFSSLRYLKDFSINVLKIDQSFMRKITRDSDYAAIVESIIRLAHNLGLQVVAEGVETDQQLDFLKKNNCHRVQGHLFSHPLPADELAKLVLNNRAVHQTRKV